MSEDTTIAMVSQKTVLTRAESLRAAAGWLRSFDPVRQAPPLPPSAGRGLSAGGSASSGGNGWWPAVGARTLPAARCDSGMPGDALMSR